MTLALGTLETWHRHAMESALPEGRDGVTDAERVAMLETLEDLKNTISAIQGDLAVDLDASQRAQQAAAGEPARRQGRGVGHQVALARRESPHRGQVFLSVAKTLRAEMPYTADAVRTGRLSEYAATLMVRETSCLTVEDRRWVDEAMCADETVLEGVGTRRLVGMLRSHAARLDPAAVVRRNRKAESERTVSLRPAPDTMSYLTGALPATQGIACWAALQHAVAAAKAAGDERPKGQIMADTLVARLTGQEQAEEAPITVNVVMSDDSLFGGGHEPADVPGYGPVPAQIARHLIANSMDSEAAQTFIRGLYADPHGRLVAMTTRQRLHTETIAEFLRLRDQGICRTPWCDAPIAQSDHIHTADNGGETSAENGQGLCEACNHAKQAPAWAQTTDPHSHRHRVTTITPTGHRYRSTAPRAPTPARGHPPHTPAERVVVDIIRNIDLVLGA